MWQFLRGAELSQRGALNRLFPAMGERRTLFRSVSVNAFDRPQGAADYPAQMSEIKASAP